MDNRNRWIAAALLAMNFSPTWGQSDPHSGHAPPPAAPATGMEPVNHGAMSASPKEPGAMPGMDSGAHAAMQHEAAPPGLRDPHAYSGGYDFSQFPMRHEGGAFKFGVVRVDRFESVRSGDSTLTAYDAQASYGGDFDRAVLKAEGDIDSGELAEAGTELLWGHAVTAFWNTQLGLRYDGGAGPQRSWLAFGIQGLVPYWFEVDATAYVGEEGRSALSVEAEYELLLTQKLILQPRIEANWYGNSDARRGVGSGLSNLAAGVRLRYEIRRELAPYIGIEWNGKFGGTAGYARDAGSDAKETRAVAGVRFWF